MYYANDSNLSAFCLCRSHVEKTDVAGNCLLMLACYPTVEGNLMYRLVVLTVPSRMPGIIWLNARCDISSYLWITLQNYVVP